jgi:ATP-binding cassette subfamily C (CFTR/MRP) protein 1
VTIPTAQLTAIIGPVASGKSTFLKALLGEIPVSQGSVRVRTNSNIAFCDQTPWLLNASARDNVIGYSHTDNIWYDTVIQACCLEADFESFPDGDASIIGTKGITLSGGQKQRLVRTNSAMPLDI